jgi:hypothetical protein
VLRLSPPFNASANTTPKNLPDGPQPNKSHTMKDYSATELAGMTALQASQTFQQQVLDINKTEPDFIQCWAKARDLMPRLFARAFPSGSAGAAAVAMANGASAAPVAYQFHLPLMRLPTDTTADEFKAAWLGNGSKATPLDAKGMIEALVGYTSGRQGVSTEAARSMVARRFPGLTDFANKQLPAS